MIKIKDFFETPDHNKWLELAKKSIKSEHQLNYDTLEGVRLGIDYTETEDIYLSSFPDSVKYIETINGCDVFNALIEKKDLSTESELIINTSLVHNSGASIVQEIIFFLSLLESCSSLKNKTIKLLVSIDSLYFNNIAKLRAMRFLVESLKEHYSLEDVIIIGETSKREQTLYDPWVNMLRSSSAVSAMFNGGADEIRIDSYDQLGKDHFNYEGKSLGKRQAENTFYILNEESFLGKVKDPARGSYTIESLTKDYISLGFDEFKNLRANGGLLKNLNKFSLEVELIANKRKERAHKQRVNIAGSNNFPNVDESLLDYYGELKTQKNESKFFPMRRTSRELEELRFKLESKDLKIKILTLGEQKDLSARLSFIKNFLELTGHSAEVESIGEHNSDEKLDVLALCSLDENYSTFSDYELPSARFKFLASKEAKVDQFENVYMGKNIIETFSCLLKEEN